MYSSDNNNLLYELEDKLKEIYPGFEFKFSSGSEVNGQTHSSLFEFFISQNSFNETLYNIDSTRNFIHYTSIESLSQILNSGSLRLYSLNGMNDPFEFNALIKKYDLSIGANEIELFKRSLFVSSFCRYEPGHLEDEFQMWRLYGREGNGVGIVFEIINENSDWENFIIGKVQYDFTNTASKKLQNAIELINGYVKDRGLVLDRIPALIGIFLSLHKNQIWSIENEYRFSSFYQYEPETYVDSSFDNQMAAATALHHFKSNGNEVASIDFPLVSFLKRKLNDIYKNELDDTQLIKEFNRYPHIKIKEIIVGYQVSEKIFQELENYIYRLASHKFYPLSYIKVSRSHLKNWFND